MSLTAEGLSEHLQANLEAQTTLDFVQTHPFLTAKLLALQGMQTYRGAPPHLHEDMTSAQFTEGERRLRYHREVAITEALLMGHLAREKPYIQEAIAEAFEMWQHFPPTAAEFSTEELTTLADVEGSGFVELALPLIPIRSADYKL